jgi:ACT domain-containing protein
MVAFLRELAATQSVSAAAKSVGMSRQSAYKLRQPIAPFSAARAADDEALLAMRPERLLRTLSELSVGCKLRDAGTAAQDCVGVVAGV